ncbi:MAG TPA: alanine--glyoxylate aminotransferase family protein [Candidatus Binatia bacterium]|nr:alanine--glyoxylate aminotransferase family protein [Candidatus Binatia bacterium]
MILLNPGPVNVSPRVTAALRRGDVCHREPEFSDLLDSVRSKLVRAFAPTGWAAVPLTGSGTLALEAAVSSSVAPGRKLLAIVNGVYGERIAEMARVHGIAVVELGRSWTEAPEPADVAAALAADPAIEVVALVHHETTTGLRNPVRAVGEAVRAAGRVFLVDAISGLAGDPLELDAWGVDVCVGVANKCIQGLPGIGFVLARERELARMAELPPRSVYMHLPRHHAAHEKRTVPFTAAVQVLYALDEALSELLEETVAGRIERYARAAAQLRAGFDELGLEMLLPPALRSNSITALALPAGVEYAALHDRLKADGFVIYEGQGKLARAAFRVANMGALASADFARFLESLARALAGDAERAPA